MSVLVELLEIGYRGSLRTCHELKRHGNALFIVRHVCGIGCGCDWVDVVWGAMCLVFTERERQQWEVEVTVVMSFLPDPPVCATLRLTCEVWLERR